MKSNDLTMHTRSRKQPFPPLTTALNKPNSDVFAEHESIAAPFPSPSFISKMSEQLNTIRLLSKNLNPSTPINTSLINTSHVSNVSPTLAHNVSIINPNVSPSGTLNLSKNLNPSTPINTSHGSNASPTLAHNASIISPTLAHNASITNPNVSPSLVKTIVSPCTPAILFRDGDDLIMGQDRINSDLETLHIGKGTSDRIQSRFKLNNTLLDLQNQISNQDSRILSLAESQEAMFSTLSNQLGQIMSYISNVSHVLESSPALHNDNIITVTSPPTTITTITPKAYSPKDMQFLLDQLLSTMHMIVISFY